MTREKIDTDAILKLVEQASATFQEGLTPEERALLQQPRKVDEVPPAYAAEEGALAENEFDLIAAQDAMETLARQIESIVERRHQAAYEESLRVYYIAEELAGSGEHPELIPHVEAMRSAHEKQYGKPIPPKKRS